MPDSTLQAVARSLGQDMKVMSNVSNNVANMHTPGFRRTQTIPSFQDVAAGAGVIDQRDGTLSQTTRPLDLALRGPGFFAVQHGDETLLTRSGAFHLDANGVLVTAAGDPVMGDTGPITLTPDMKVRIDAQGQLWSDTQQVGQLRLVSVADARTLVARGGGLYANGGAEAEWKGSVVQGALEQANVDPADEMVRLMETTRHVESVQRVISIYDKAMDTGINRLGDN